MKKLLFLLGVFLIACSPTKEEKLQKGFLQDSLQYEQSESLKKSSQKDTLELDTALNNLNSTDPAIPVIEE